MICLVERDITTGRTHNVKMTLLTSNYELRITNDEVENLLITSVWIPAVKLNKSCPIHVGQIGH